MAPLAAPRAANPTPAASLPELVRTKHRVFTIPFKLPPPQSPDAAAQRVLLSVSTDLGVTWTQAGEAAPDAEAFTYRAKADGEYWFQLRAIDAKGRSRGGAGPDIRVLVDAAGPKVVARVWKGADGEIMCRYAALDDSLRLESLIVEYRGPGDQAWKKLTADGVLCRESPAHLLGEEIWWAGERVDSLAVRISVSDSSGNATEKQFSLEPTDPHVAQAARARELGAPPLPATDGALPTPDRIVNAAGAAGTERNRPASTGLASATSPLQPPPSRPGQWAPEPATPWAADGPGSVVARSVGTGPSGATPMAERAPTTMPTAAGRPPAEYRGKPLQLVRSRRFAWDYEFPPGQPETGPVRVELWSTRDGGVTWQRVAVDDDTTSPIHVSLPASGLHGFRLDVVPDLPDVAGGPQPGDAPDCWLGVDDEPPSVELIEVARAQPGEPVGMVIRYAAQDQMLVPDSIRISFAPHAEGPWTTVIDGLGTQGEYRWQPPRTIPAKVHVRVEATDAAGNVGTATSSGPVLVVTPRVVGKLGGVTATPQP